MALKIKIQEDLRVALKEKKEITLATLRMLLSAINNRETEKRTRLYRDFGGQAKISESELIKKLEESSKLTDEETIEVISSEIKKRKEAIAGFEQGGRQELAEKEQKESEILAKYLPEQLSEEEIKKQLEELNK